MRFVFIDRIDEIEKNKYAKGVKVISFEEGFLKSPCYSQGTFPPLLLLEAGAQLASWLIMYSSGFKWLPMIAKMDKVSLSENVKSGDVLNIEVTILSMNEEGALLNAEIFSSGRLIAKGENCLCVFARLEEFADPAEMSARFLDLSQHAKFIEAGTGPQPMKADETIPSRLKNLRKKTRFSPMSSIEGGEE